MILRTMPFAVAGRAFLVVSGFALLLLAPCGSAAAEPARPAPAEALAGLDALIEQALKDQMIPGASVGVVVGDEVVLLKGYGMRDAAKSLPMTPDTIIPIASVTKQFTVAALGTLVSRGKLEWEKPVRDYLPDFRVHDDYATLNATPRDLVTHRIGMPRHDMLWFGSTLSREDFYTRLRDLPFSRGIRTEFQYNNLMYMTAGVLAGRLSGGTWEDLVRAALLTPLGMSRTNFAVGEMLKDRDRSSAYKLGLKREIIDDEFEVIDAMGPTGSINSTARDMTAYLRMMLAGGEFGGKRLVQTEDIRAMMRPWTPIGPATYAEDGFTSYGMGLFVATYRGHEIAYHGGNLPGAAAMVLMVPRERIGVVVLTNRSGAVLRDGLPYEIVDRLMGMPSSGRVAQAAERERKALAAAEAGRAPAETKRAPGAPHAHAIGEYAGVYNHPGYGDVRIALAGDRLTLSYNAFSTPLEHCRFEVFQAPVDPKNRLDATRVQFLTDIDGEVSSLAIPFEASLQPTVFTRKPPTEMLERAFLEPLLGVYDVAGIEQEVALREDGKPVLVARGRATELIPVRGTTYRIKGVSGVIIEFLRPEGDARGKADRIAIQADERAVFPRKR